MSKLIILGCGTSTGVPIPGCRCSVCTSENPKNDRLRTSAFVQTGETDGVGILIDTGPDLRQQALRADIRELEGVVFTHHHSDHVLGLDDLRAYNFVQKSDIACYASRETFEALERVFSYVFKPNPDYQGGQLARLSTHTIEKDVPFFIGETEITPLGLKHGSLDVLGFKIGNLAYATDCNAISPSALEHLTGIEHLILDGLRYEEHRTHYTIEQAIEVAYKLKARNTYFIHMTHTVDYDEVNPHLPETMQLCYDGLEIEFDRFAN